MKKILALILATMMLFALVACDNNGENNANQTTTQTPPQTEQPTGPSKEELAASASIEEIAKALGNKYADYAGMRDMYDQYMAELEEADRIPYEEFISFQLSVAPVETGAEWLMGFTTAPTGFSEAYCYQPMMMGQAFIGYIFRVAEGTDVEAFKTSLKDNCDPRWNICTMANTTVCENYGNIVYFSMMVIADEENPNGFTADQKQGFYDTFVAAIEKTAK